MQSDETVIIANVPLDYQYPHLPTGCEATALSMLLRWAGIQTNKFEVADQLPKGDKVHEVSGKWYGANPNKVFVGDPYSDEGSFGLFENPILTTIEKFLPEKGVNLTDKPFTELLNIVKNGRPVMAWTTLKQNETFYIRSWEDKQGNTIDWYHYEHAVVIVGSDAYDIIVNDPDTGKQEYYERKLFEKNWMSMGKRAVTVDVEV